MNGTSGGTTFTDYSAAIKGSGSAKTITVNGNSQTSTTQSFWYGSSGYFDSSSTLGVSDLNGGTNITDFTFESWIYLPTTGSQFGFFSNQTFDNEANTMRIGTTPSKDIWMKIGSTSLESTGGKIRAAKWFHLAVTRSGSAVKIYINGSSVATTTASDTISPSGFYIGVTYPATTFTLTGFMQDVRFYTSAKYSSNFTPPINAPYKTLCTTNLPDPTIADGSTAMDATTYTGAAGTQTISGINYSPDFVWIKSRNIADQHCLFDTVRGTLARLQSNSTNAESSLNQYGSLTAFNSDGFTLTAGSSGSDQTHGSGNTYVAWTWDAGSSTVTNTDGSITSQVRANPSAGFSVVTWTGTLAAATIGHGLGSVPKFIIVKNRDSSIVDWRVYHGSLGADEGLYLNKIDGKVTGRNDWWNNTRPTSTLFSVANDTGVNGINDAMVAYCFAPVEGYSAFGSYTGNGSTDGPFVYTGFRPRWVMIKRTDLVSTTIGWRIMDTARMPSNTGDIGPVLAADSTGAENQYSVVDLLSNSFKVRVTDGNLNVNGGTYIYAAFAENPFKTARAR
jgi:hypothetical protein